MWGPEQWGLVALGGFLAFLSCVLYMWGGTENVPTKELAGKFWRRFLASLVLAIDANMIAYFSGTWNPKFLLIWPALIFGFCLPYGGDDTMEKFIKRGVFASGVLLASGIGLWAVAHNGHAYLVLVLQAVLGGVSIILGVFNPFKNAPLEQYLICQVLTLFVPFWGMVK